jgi:transcription-repair coupling factor (superfamily II helicase)
MGTTLRLVGLDLPDSRQLRLQRMYPGSKWFAQQRTATVPMPTAASDDDLVTWVGQVLQNLYAAEAAPAST